MTTEYKTLLMRRDTSTNFDTYDVVPKLGEFCYETDTKKLCIGDGETAEIDLPKFIQESVLIGAVQWFATATVPSGYLLCDGRAISRTTYSKLYAIIGTNFGSGDGSTTFNLPVLTDNRFIEGSTTIGTAKNAGLPSIAHTHTVTGAYNETRQIWNLEDANATNGIASSQTTSAMSTVSSIYGSSDTVQPKSLTLLPCIKY